MLENISNSGLPVEQDIIDEARAELKREKWIKKYNDIQMIGNPAPRFSDSQDSASQSKGILMKPEKDKNALPPVRIKNLELLIKEFSSSPEIYKDETCKQ